MVDSDTGSNLADVRGELRDRLGIDPTSPRQILRLADLGVVLQTWRNGPVESLHAGSGPLSDGDMLRINSYTTWRVRGITDRWWREVLRQSGAGAAEGAIHDEDFEILVMRWYRWFVNPSRVLPGGATLRDMAGADLLELQAHVDSTLSALLKLAKRQGADTAVLFLAVQGAFQATQWWGHPQWTRLVDRFVVALDDPTDAHWSSIPSWRDRLPPEPVEVVDRLYLRKRLRTAPWMLRADTAEWLVDAGIGSMQVVDDRA
ncbi:hypothetical protein [Cryobacterium melibiosiphilum]|uniref:hypothetical protein n=1 Tax=Cryobacterium melibiosiphilum TaxID=995039 RepID=UPI0011C20EDE|nr:hypothetical protein [Cryobacterium melibiosiphilum]